MPGSVSRWNLGISKDGHSHHLSGHLRPSLFDQFKCIFLIMPFNEAVLLDNI